MKNSSHSQGTQKIAMKKSLPHKLLSNAIRLPFGDSNRKGHLRMSRCASVVAAVSVFWGAIHLGYGHYAASGLAMVASVACLHMEHWASADRDQAEKGYWSLYDRWCKHRSCRSHSLLPGTLLRLLYGYWGVPFLLLWLNPPVGAAWIVGALINDLGHLILDI